MMTRRFCMSAMTAAFVCGFLSTIPAASAAEKAAEVSMAKPSAPWAVTRIAAPADTGASFCSMKAAFPGDQMLVFARDNQSANSIALDVRKDLFDAGRQYGVTLRVGGLKRRVIGLAATNQILLMQTGIDTGLYTALWNKHQLTIDTHTAKYSFDLDVSVADALRALGRCSDALAIGSTDFAEVVPALGATQETPLPEVSEDVASSAHDDDSTPPATKSESKAEDQSEKPAAKKPSSSKKSARAKKSAPATDSMATEMAMLRAENQSLRAQAEVREAVQQEINARGAYSASAAPVALRPVTPATSAVSMTVDTSGLKSLIVSAQVASSADIRTEGDRTLRWTSNDLFGSAQALQAPLGQSLADVASGHVKRFETACKGQFAQKLGQQKRVGSSDVLEADVTCIDGQNDAAAAVLFISSKGKLSVITQEGTPGQLNIAMSQREALIDAAAGGTF